MLIIRGVNLFPTQIEELLLQDGRLSPHYQLQVDRPGNMDELTVRVEPKIEVAGDADAVAAAGRDLKERIKTMCGVTAKIEMNEIDGVPRSQGKAQRIVDNRPKG